MKRIVLFYSGQLCPTATGTARVVADMAATLKARPDVHLTLVVLDGRMDMAGLDACRRLCDEFVRLRPASRWSVCGILNGLARRLGADVHAAYFRALAVRRQMTELCASADVVLLNSTIWYPVLPAGLRAQKATVITHDVLFQRRESFKGRGGCLRRLTTAIHRKFEMAVLRSFGRVAVFADYEKKLLEAGGLPSDRIVVLGLAIVCAPLGEPVEKRWDFLLLGGNCLQNEEAVECFVERVVPLLGGRRVSLAVAGSICQSAVWDRLEIPRTVSVEKLGSVPDLAEVCARARIGVSTPKHGSGVKVKTVECIECGLPMVVTDCGEEGIPVTDEGTVNIDRMSPAESARRIAGWLDSPSSAAVVGRRQAEAVRAAFCPDRMAARIARKGQSLLT